MLPPVAVHAESPPFFHHPLPCPHSCFPRPRSSSRPFNFSLTCLWSASSVIPSRFLSMTRFHILPLFSRSGSPPITCFLISYFLDIILMRASTADRMHRCNNVLLLDVAFPHTRARASSRQFEIAECRCQLLLPVLCGVARAVQDGSQQPAHVFGW